MLINIVLFANLSLLPNVSTVKKNIRQEILIMSIIKLKSNKSSLSEKHAQVYTQLWNLPNSFSCLSSLPRQNSQSIRLWNSSDTQQLANENVSLNLEKLKQKLPILIQTFLVCLSSRSLSRKWIWIRNSSRQQSNLLEILKKAQSLCQISNLSLNVKSCPIQCP